MRLALVATLLACSLIALDAMTMPSMTPHAQAAPSNRADTALPGPPN